MFRSAQTIIRGFKLHLIHTHKLTVLPQTGRQYTFQHTITQNTQQQKQENLK